MEIIQAIKKLPKEDQLTAAFDLIQDLIGGADQDEIYFQDRFGLTRAEARTFSTLLAGHGRPVSKETVLCALGELTGSDPGIKMVDVMVCKIRRKLRDRDHNEWILTHWGRGYAVSSEALAEIPDVRARGSSLPVRHPRWTQEEDQDLIRMMSRGDDMNIVADELDRSARACIEHYRELTRTH